MYKLFYLSKVVNSVNEYGLIPFTRYVFEEVGFEAFAVTHLAEDVTVGAQDAFDVVVGTVGVLGVAEGYLAVGKEFLCKAFVNYELALSVAECNLVFVAFAEAAEPG